MLFSRLLKGAKWVKRLLFMIRTHLPIASWSGRCILGIADSRSRVSGYGKGLNIISFKTFDLFGLNRCVWFIDLIIPYAERRGYRGGCQPGELEIHASKRISQCQDPDD